MNSLAAEKCEPCAGKSEALKNGEISELHDRLGKDWQVIDNHHLERTFQFKDFRQALNFTNQIGEIAEAMNHHPDIYLTWGKVRVTIFTHSVNGLTKNDFVLAAKFEELKKT